MTTKQTKGYTKSIMGQMTFDQLNEVLKKPNEPLDKWIIKKTEQSVYGGMDEKGMNRKEDVQNPNPPLI